MSLSLVCRATRRCDALDALIFPGELVVEELLGFRVPKRAGRRGASLTSATGSNWSRCPPRARKPCSRQRRRSRPLGIRCAGSSSRRGMCRSRGSSSARECTSAPATSIFFTIPFYGSLGIGERRRRLFPSAAPPAELPLQVAAGTIKSSPRRSHSGRNDLDPVEHASPAEPAGRGSKLTLTGFEAESM
jgi:hypothetical protein